MATLENQLEERTKLPAQGQIEYLVKQTATCVLRPKAFFVSWHGVLTLAYSGFPPSLASLKDALNDTVSGLPQEYSGSRWPKTSLGALHDKARLTPEQLRVLNKICREESSNLSQEATDQAALVDKLTVVFYECRCLERRLLEHTISLAAGAPVDSRQPEDSELDRVRSVVSEADNPDYWFAASKDGSRETHYRSTHAGLTLVHDLAPFRAPAAPAGAGSGAVNYGSALPDLVRAFRARVDAELPGLYRWFRDDSLHCTVRSLLG